MSKERYWSKLADEYETKTNYIIGADEQRLILGEVAKITELKNTLELGCGHGAFSKVISANATSVLATDYSAEMVAIATLKLESYSNIKVQAQNCLDLKYKNESFDTVFMANLFHVIGEQELALNEAMRVLKPNGRLIILSYTTEGMTVKNTETMITRYLESYGPPSKDAKTLTCATSKNLLEKTCFKVEQLKLVGNNMHAILAIARK